jgi:anthranilate phosphoribosyltransferase
VGGAVDDLAEGLAAAGLAIDDGRAQGALDALIRVSQAHAE